MPLTTFCVLDPLPNIWHLKALVLTCSRGTREFHTRCGSSTGGDLPASESPEVWVVQQLYRQRQGPQNPLAEAALLSLKKRSPTQKAPTEQQHRRTNLVSNRRFHDHWGTLGISLKLLFSLLTFKPPPSFTCTALSRGNLNLMQHTKCAEIPWDICPAIYIIVPAILFKSPSCSFPFVSSPSHIQWCHTSAQANTKTCHLLIRRCSSQGFFPPPPKFTVRASPSFKRLSFPEATCTRLVNQIPTDSL